MGRKNRTWCVNTAAVTFTAAALTPFPDLIYSTAADATAAVGAREISTQGRSWVVVSTICPDKCDY